MIYLGNKKVSMRGIVIDNSKLAQLVDRSITEVTAKDLEGATKIGNQAFAYCDLLTNISIPNSVTSIEQYAFRNCSRLTSIEIPDSVESIGQYAFSYCGVLINVRLSNSLKSIKERVFGNCTSLTSIVIPDSVTSIEQYAFYYCSKLESIEFGENSQLTNIGSYAFSNVGYVKNFTIPARVTSIGSSVIRWGASYQQGTVRVLPTTPPTIQSTSIDGYIQKIIVPKGCLEAYQTATNWSKWASIMEEATE